MRDQLNSITQGQHGGLLTFGFAMALWSSSAAVVAVTDALNRVYDIDEGRPWWKVRLTAILLTIGLAAFVLVAMGLILVGPTLAEWLATRTGLGSVFEWTWKILQWPIVFALVATALAVLNYFAPDADQDWTWVSPGAVLATVLWLVASLAFKLYVANFANYNATYGSLGGIIVLMLWFYISGLAILVGAEMNAEIEHASPYGKDPGEKVPGQKKKLGARAARAFEEARRAGRKGPGASQPRRLTRTALHRSMRSRTSADSSLASRCSCLRGGSAGRATPASESRATDRSRTKGSRMLRGGRKVDIPSWKTSSRLWHPVNSTPFSLVQLTSCFLQDVR